MTLKILTSQFEDKTYFYIVEVFSDLQFAIVSIELANCATFIV